MYSLGKYKLASGEEYNALVNHKKSYLEIILYTDTGAIVSAYKKTDTYEGAAVSKLANDLARSLTRGIASCNSKNGVPVAFVLGSCSKHTFKKSNINYEISKFNNELCGAYITTEMFMLELDYCDQNVQIPTIEYVEYTHKSNDNDLKEASGEDDIPVRSLDEIALEKDLTWLKDKKYFVVNDEQTAEQIFSYLDNYNNTISFDTETTGLKINMFCQIGSDKKKEIEEYNAKAIANGKNPVRTDKLVGFIYCIEPNVSYYFPCFNRKFKNLYEDVNEPVTRKTVTNILASYTIGEYRDRHDFMAEFIRNTPPEQWGPDVILMERNRKILSTKNLLAHNGTFEWKVCWNYWIDFHLVDDTIILHQLMYKFRSTTRNSGEPSNLKYLSKRELGVDQLELTDFFDGFSEDDSGKATGAVRKGKKANVKIDFSYMDYDGSRAYAPADGDLTLELFLKYKPDLIKNHKELEYLYAVEILVAQAIGYMEYYGHRIDPVKIDNIHKKYVADKISIEYKIRDLINYNTPEEKEVYSHIEETNKQIDELDKAIDNIKKENPEDSLIDELKKERDEQYKFKESLQTKLVELFENSENQLNLASPAQVAELFYDKLQIPCSEEKKSVNKKIVKGLLKAKNEDGSMKYPVVDLYSKWKNTDTYITKFFGNLPDYMYPGGYIFSSFGQISTATGRMSCIEENTPITVVGGTKPIKDIKAGDMVYCYDNEGKLRIKKVTNVMDNGYRDCIKLHWRSTGAHENGELICTPDHRILTKDRGWVKARELKYGDRVYHLRRSNEDRPRLFGANGISDQEQLVIKREVFGTTDYNLVIHHEDQITDNNDLSNLTIKTRQEHSREHTNELVKAGKIKFEHLLTNRPEQPKGMDSKLYIHKTAEELEQMLREADGYITRVPMDFETYKKKCEDIGFDYKSVVEELRPETREISDSFFIHVYNECNGVPYRIAEELWISRSAVQSRINKLGLINSDDINTTEYTSDFFKFNGDTDKLAGKYNLEKRRCLELNRKLNLTIIPISDEEFIDSFMRNKGKLRAVSRETGINWHRVDMTAKRLNLCYNHMIIGYESVGVKHVYDLEVEDCHNFIANEICVHNCKKPNAQQYPKAVTAIVNPRPGFVMVDADFSQIEYRTLVALANEQDLLNKFKDPDMDYHTTMASLMYGVPYASVSPKQRGDAKSFNFGIPYGMGFGSLAILLTGINNETTRAEAMEKYELYFKDQPHVRQYFKDVKEFANVRGYTETKWGRRRYYSFVDKDGNFSQAKKAQALRQAGNAIIQGCLDGDTKIETKEFGVKPIKELVGYSGLVWNGTDWTHGDVLYSGKKQKCIITFADDTEFICSPIHKFLLTGKDPSDINNYIECKDLTDKHYIECNTSTKSSLTKFSKAANKIAKLNELSIGLKVKSVEITDEYIDMYDVCNTDCGYYVADGIITHNTAADIFKIGVARNFAFIRKNNLFGKMIIVNMIHDEQLIEADARCLDIKAVVAALVQNMEMKIDGFPPLYVGAGVGLSWKDAKGKMNEINPKLAHQFIEEAKNISIFTDKPKTPKEVLDYFNKRVYEFRRDKIIDYVKDEKNYHQTLHPVIGNLLSLQFDYGVNAEFDAKYTEDNGYTKDEIAKAKKLIPLEQLKRFLADMGIEGIDTQLFMSEEDLKAENEVYNEEPEEEEEYTDGDEEEDDDLDSIEQSGGEKFELFDESDKASLYGVDMKDLIGEFGLLVSKKLKVCGIDATKVRAKFKESMSEYLKDHVSENEDADTDSDSLELVFLMSNNIVKHTGGYVKNIRQKELARACGLNPDMF